MRHELFGMSFRVRNKRLQKNEWLYFECLTYFKLSIILFLFLSLISTMFLRFSLVSAAFRRDFVFVSAIPVLIFAVLSLVMKWRMDHVSRQLPW